MAEIFTTPENFEIPKMDFTNIKEYQKRKLNSLNELGQNL